MTKDDLREQLKREFEKFVAFREKFRSSKDPVRPKSMQVCYRHSKMLLENDVPVGVEYKAMLVQFVRTGDLYYHAKKHGIQSALLFKLSRD